MLFIPLSARGAAAVIIAIVYITTIAKSGMAYKVFYCVGHIIYRNIDFFYERNIFVSADHSRIISGFDVDCLLFGLHKEEEVNHGRGIKGRTLRCRPSLRAWNFRSVPYLSNLRLGDRRGILFSPVIIISVLKSGDVWLRPDV